ncbi:unnamed protein product [Rotaria sp. Silwood2]|nr:unnamed protein product [Rotaria sp. Silwood2]CAF3156208.1 unnamed protein product [Rotaria sp. Silwood2]CAF3271270.1 unnamed protein product [Rotaria sp. Silwood2]CAF4137114.1 unnamed protein product [Rotaria sp. Silwood2]CAF4499221.1 unnamed protein product [Rotaria sp. Silwood2]
MPETGDILELEEIQGKQLQLKNKILSNISIFKSPHEFDVDKFLSQSEYIFSKYKYPDYIHVIKIGIKLDHILQSWFTNFKRNSTFTWNNFKNESPNFL